MVIYFGQRTDVTGGSGCQTAVTCRSLKGGGGVPPQSFSAANFKHCVDGCFTVLLAISFL